jgi:7-cyano-7-deazaguanine reductase
LLALAPEASVDELRLALLRASYRSAERAAEQHRLRLSTPAEVDAARANLTEIVRDVNSLRLQLRDKLEVAARRLSRSIGAESIALSQTVERLRSLRAQATFLQAWSMYYQAWLAGTGETARGAEPLFAELMGTESLKLYLNSFTMSRFATSEDVRRAIARDLSARAGTPIEVQLFLTNEAWLPAPLAGDCIDNSDTDCDVFDVDAQLLSADDTVVREALHSHLLRSLCPVTNQPDIGSVLVSYHGPRIDRADLLRYIVSYREHNEFHEACVERMFVDILRQCRPTQLSVYARYQRRGGIDINPFRSNFESAPSNQRTWRQ